MKQERWTPESLTVISKCAECGVRFEMVSPEDWVYKTGGSHKSKHFFCSWHCLRRNEQRTARPAKDGSAKPEFAKVRHTETTKQNVEALYLEGGRTFMQIAKDTGTSEWFVRTLLAKRGLYTPKKRGYGWTKK